MQHVTSPTRGHNKLDLIFTPNVSGIISNVRVSMLVCTSDHSTVSFNLCSIRNTNGVLYNVRSFLFSKCNVSLAYSLLSNVDWHVIFNNCLSIEDYWTAFKMTCLDVISRSTPISARTFRRNPIPRILHRAILKIKKRRLWWRYFLRTSSSSLAALKVQSRLVSSLYRIHRSRHELQVLLTYSNQNFWHFCSKCISSSNSCFPLCMTYSGLPMTDMASLPNTFNSFFTSIFNVNPLNSTLPFRHNVYAPSLSSVHLSPNDILAALLTFKLKFNSPDGIPGYFLKTFAPLLAHPLTVIFNSSLSTASLPLDWKHATVTPLYKGKGPTNDVANYRPISCTSVTGKV